MSGSAATAVAQCGDAVGYIPIPATRAGVGLWSPTLSPADVPGVRLPPDRDSTEYDSRRFPSAVNSLELFWSVDAARDHVVVGYNVGISVWSLDRGLPRRVAFADHLRGDWLGSHGAGESDGFLAEVEVEPDPASGRIAIAVASLAGVGLSIWSFDPTTGVLAQHYQDADATLDAYGESRSVELIDLGGQLLALSEAGTLGIEVFDVSRALEGDTPCGDRPRGTCRGVALGVLDGTAGFRGFGLAAVPLGESDYAAVLGGSSTGAAMRVLRAPASNPTAATEIQSRPAPGHAPEAFSLRGQRYVATVDNVTADGPATLRVERLGACTSAADCLGPTVATARVTGRRLPSHYLHASALDTEGVLYHVLRATGEGGPSVEEVLDLGALETGVVVDLAAGGGSYVEGCNAQTVNYFADAYARNEFGFRNVEPFDAVAVGTRLFRVAYGVFDVHEIARPPMALDDAAVSFDAGNTSDAATSRPRDASSGERDASVRIDAAGAATRPPVTGCACRSVQPRGRAGEALPLASAVAVSLLAWTSNGRRRRRER